MFYNFERAVQKKEQKMEKKLFKPDKLKAGVLEEAEETLGQVFEDKAKELGPLSHGSEGKGDSVKRRESEGKALLASVYGTDRFSPFISHLAGVALDAFRTGYSLRGEIGVEQLHRAIENMRPGRVGPKEPPKKFPSDHMADKRMGLKTYEEHKADMDAAVSELRAIAGPKSEEPKATE